MEPRERVGVLVNLGEEVAQTCTPGLRLLVERARYAGMSPEEQERRCGLAIDRVRLPAGENPGPEREKAFVARPSWPWSRAVTRYL